MEEQLDQVVYMFFLSRLPQMRVAGAGIAKINFPGIRYWHGQFAALIEFDLDVLSVVLSDGRIFVVGDAPFVVGLAPFQWSPTAMMRVSEA
jgi:hypothetical protein